MEILIWQWQTNSKYCTVYFIAIMTCNMQTTTNILFHHDTEFKVRVLNAIGWIFISFKLPPVGKNSNILMDYAIKDKIFLQLKDYFQQKKGL